MKTEIWRVIVVLVDHCLSTFKIVAGYDKPEEKQLRNMLEGMSSKYFNELPGSHMTVLGRVFRSGTMDEAKDWVRTFNAHPDQSPLFYASVYPTSYSEHCDLYTGKLQIPVGDKCSDAYPQKEKDTYVLYDGDLCRNFCGYTAPELLKNM